MSLVVDKLYAELEALCAEWEAKYEAALAKIEACEEDWKDKDDKTGSPIEELSQDLRDCHIRVDHFYEAVVHCGHLKRHCDPNIDHPLTADDVQHHSARTVYFKHAGETGLPFEHPDLGKAPVHPAVHRAAMAKVLAILKKNENNSCYAPPPGNWSDQAKAVHRLRGRMNRGFVWMD